MQSKINKITEECDMDQKPNEDDYAMMLKRVWYKLRKNDEYAEINAQIADLLKRGEKWTILRAQNEPG